MALQRAKEWEHVVGSPKAWLTKISRTLRYSSGPKKGKPRPGVTIIADPTQPAGTGHALVVWSKVVTVKKQKHTYYATFVAYPNATTPADSVITLTVSAPTSWANTIFSAIVTKLAIKDKPAPTEWF